MDRSAPEKTAHGLSVLVVEDDSLTRQMVADTLEDLGAGAVRHAAGVKAALRLVDEKAPDLAVIDVNLTGQLVYPVAVRLDEMRVPLVFLTAYDRKQLPAFWQSRPVVNKPFHADALAAAITAALNPQA